MSLCELIRWGWANDRAACLIPVAVPVALAMLLVTLEIVT